MARIFTTPEAEKAAKAWLHDLTYAAGVRTTNQRSNGQVYMSPHFTSAAQVVCDEILNRDFTNVDSSIRSLAGIRFNANMTGHSQYKAYKAEGIAKSLVYLAELLQLYWDDTIRTPYEIDEFKKTLLGTAVYKYKRNLSALTDKPSRASRTTSKSPGQPPKNNYKQSGPQSSNVRDLQGQPGQKVKADTNFIYKIVGENPASKNTPQVFIKPLSAAGATGSTNKIFISSGNGYTDCTCYFDDSNDATDFLNKIIANNRVPANISNLRVVKNRADSNGYFLVGTEFGTCAVSAKTLNEALREAIEELAHPSGWEKATEGYSNKKLDELHTWMRRG